MTQELEIFDTSVPVCGNNRNKVTTISELTDGGLLHFIMNHALRYRRVVFHTYKIDLIRKPFNKAMLIRLMTLGQCWIKPSNSVPVRLTLTKIAGWALRSGWAGIKGRYERKIFLKRIIDLLPDKKPGTLMRQEGLPVYLRTDQVYGLIAGGSVGHIAGVVNNIRNREGSALMVTTDEIPGVSKAVETYIVQPGPQYADYPEIRQLLSVKPFVNSVINVLGARRPAFFYQRYSVNDISGVLLAKKYAVPLVLEYNGSEVWVNRNWGRPLQGEGIALRMEQLNLDMADMIVAVSEVLKVELIQRGVDKRRILVNPNGVDCDRYHPEVDGESIRSKYALDDFQVIGFIGTFGPWHGAELLVEAVGSLMRRYPEYKAKIRLLLIGDGQRMTAVRKLIADLDISEQCVLTGQVPQHLGPAHLAVCDILVAPHVPNQDGSKFFGSPTKLFEYMAMGKAIIASNLEQIGEILVQDSTALLVPPGDRESLTDGLQALINDSAMRARLGAAARKAAKDRFSWEKHTDRILAAINTL